jgi:RNA polymerase sigma-70 factor (ECF subfamily)
MTTTLIWNEFSEYLLHFLRKKTRSDEDAKDLTQEVFLRIHKRLDSLHDETKLKAWIFRIARNVLNDYYRQRNPMQPLGDLDPEAEDDKSLYAEWDQCLQPFIKALPAKYRTAIEMSELQGLKQQQVADALGISLSGAKSRIQRGREMIKTSFMDCCSFVMDENGKLKRGHEPTNCIHCG